MTNQEIQKLREKPARFIAQAIELLKEIDGKVIVEIGSMRQDLKHALNEVHPCCNDGHSSALWAQTGLEFHSVDIDPNCTRIVSKTLAQLGCVSNSKAYTTDGIGFLRDFEGTIDLLFLDAWDIGTPSYAESHLEAWEAAKDKLAATHIILIDDTDVDYVGKELEFIDGAMAGKGRLLIPRLIQEGYEVLTAGRQTLLIKRDQSENSDELRAIFSEIYANNTWGGQAGQLYSGGGSDLENTKPYREFVNQFMADHQIMSILDLGCGDFRVGGNIDLEGRTYIGVDIVPQVVESLNAKYASENVSFNCLNIVEDNLPLADLCLVRQVFQHLSNADILSTLSKLRKFKHVLITDGVPASGEGPPNMDKVADNFTRINKHRSGLYLEKPPFNQTGKVVLEYRLWSEKLRTFHVTND